jgi:hypothetical protein
MGVEKAPDGGGGRRGAFAAEKPSRAGRPVRRRRPTRLPRWRLGGWRRPPGGSRWRAAAGWWTGGCSVELCRRHREIWREVDVRWMVGADGWN